MYEHHHLLEARLSQQPDQLSRVLAQDALVDPAPPPSIGRYVARALLLIVAVVARGNRPRNSAKQRTVSERVAGEAT